MNTKLDLRKYHIKEQVYLLTNNYKIRKAMATAKDFESVKNTIELVADVSEDTLIHFSDKWNTGK